MYDSTKDTMAHKALVEKVGNKLLSEMEKRIKEHDKSKLESPEKEVYDKYIPLLKEVKYASPEYEELRNAMKKDGLEHHFKENRHHPEHYKNGIEDMTLVDIFEMFCDHMGSSMRSDTGFLPGNERNAKVYKYPEKLNKIFINTYKEFF